MEAMPNFVEDFGDRTFPLRASGTTFYPSIPENKRPVEYPMITVITNACESAPYRIATNVQIHDRFWIKNNLFFHMAGDLRCRSLKAEQSIRPFERFELSPVAQSVSGRIVKTR